MAAAETILLLPQLFACYSHPAKRVLVNNQSTSDNEMVLPFDQRMITNGLSNSLSELRSIVAPSNASTKKFLTIRKVPSQNEMWECIRNNYTYLMDTNLVETCKETKQELSGELNRPTGWTCTKFIKEFNDLHDQLHSLHVAALEDQNKVHFLQHSLSKLRSLWKKCELLNEESRGLERTYPTMADDISRRCNILRNKWEALERCIWPKQEVNSGSVVNAKICAQMNQLRSWLLEVDSKLTSLMANKAWSPERLREAFGHQKVLQHEIETSGKDVTSLLRQVESLDGSGVDRAKLLRSVRNLEHKWHAVWLRSLENNCLTELYLQDNQSKKPTDCLDADSDEGPQSKKHCRVINKLGPSPRRKTQSSMENDESSQRSKSTRHSKTVASTRDMSTFCKFAKDISPTNDKCIMVGTTGIAALKAKYGDDFSNFEIIQDVGYSSESSTHLSGDDIGDFNQVYSYSPPKKLDGTSYTFKSVLKMKEEVTKLDDPYSSQPVVPSVIHNDSGFGTVENEMCQAESESNISGKEEDEVEKLSMSEDSDTTDLEDCINFSFIFSKYGDEESVGSESSLDGLESDISDGILNRSSITSDAQLYYKMISVDSEGGDLDLFDDESWDNGNSLSNQKMVSEYNGNNVPRDDAKDVDNGEINLRSTSPSKISLVITNGLSGALELDSSDINLETDLSDGFALEANNYRHRVSCSTPYEHRHHHHYHRRRHHFPLQKHQKSSFDVEGEKPEVRRSSTSRRINNWLDHNDSVHVQECPENENQIVPVITDIDSSCDASGEYTSTTESDVESSFASSNEENDRCYSPLSRSAVGSMETIIPLEIELPQSKMVPESHILLPPPPPPTPPKVHSPCPPKSWSPNKSKSLLHVKSKSEGHLRDLISSFNESSEREFPSRTNFRKRPLSLTLAYVGNFPLPSQPSPVTKSTRCLKSQSLPSILPSDSFQSSNSDHCHSNPTPKSRHLRVEDQSKKSRFRRRRRRRSASSGHSKHKKVLNSSEMSVRKRHWSQVQVPVQEAVISKSVQNVSCYRAVNNRLSAASPDSDVILFHLEEQSTVSDQVWDGYQDMPYLSEGCSETIVDEEALRKLTEFGDDYGDAIGPSAINRFGSDGTQSPMSPTDGRANSNSSKKFQIIPTTIETYVLDSDSDVEDLSSVLKDSSKALQFATNTFVAGLTSSEIAELHATCETHLSCLQSIQENMVANKHGNSLVTDEYMDKLHGLISEWDILTDMVQGSEAEQLLDISIKNMFERILQQAVKPSEISSVEDVEKIISQLQMALSALYDIKNPELITLNVGVHQYVTHQDGDSSLKDRITKLYRVWEDVYEQNRALMTKFHGIANQLETYKTIVEDLRSKLDSVSSIDTSMLFEERKEMYLGLQLCLTALQTQEKHMQANLNEYDLWTKIESDVQLLDSVVQLAFRKDLEIAAQILGESSDIERCEVPHLEPSKSESEDAQDGNSEDLVIQKPVDSEERRPSRFWRVFRIALPIQMSLMVLFCIAVVLEPDCCTLLNNINFSLVPQLRYYRGPPPV